MNNSSISVVIPTCKLSPLLWDAIDSTLASSQNSPVQEILVVPNAGDQNEQIGRTIEERYRNTPIRVIIRKSSDILPIFANWDDSISYASGAFVHLFHDDDLVDLDFYSTANDLIARYPDSALVYLPARFFGELAGETTIPAQEGVWQNAQLHLSTHNHFLCPGVIFRKNFHQGFDSKLKFTSDWKAWYFLSTRGNVVVHPKCFCSYRVHPQSSTSHIITSGTNVRETLMTAKELSSHHKNTTGIQPKNVGGFAASLGYAECIHAVKRGDFGVAFLQLRLATYANFSLYSLALCSKRILQHLILQK